MRRSCAVVAGGAGFIGSHLCRRLLLDGHEVVCIDNLLTGSADNIRGLSELGPFRFVQQDVVEPFPLPGDVDAVFNLASPASPLDYLRHPLQTLAAGSAGTLNTLELAREKGARYVLASTSEVYGDPDVHPQPESYWGNVNPVGLRSVYNEAKRYAEALVSAHRRSHGTDTAIARIFNTYGPRMKATDGRAVPTFVTQALNGAPITVAGSGDQTRSLCYVDDLVEGLVRLQSASLMGPVNLGNPQEISILELARLVREVTGSSSPITFIERPDDDPGRRRPDTTIARAELGWTPMIDLTTGVERTVTWFRSTRAAPAMS